MHNIIVTKSNFLYNIEEMELKLQKTQTKWLAVSSCLPANLANKQSLITGPVILSMFYLIVKTANAVGDFLIQYMQTGP